MNQTDLLPPQPATTRGSSTFLSYDPINDRIAYAAGKSVFVRPLDPASKLHTIQFTKHTYTATAAAFSPSGNYVASGDDAGNVKIWDTSIKKDDDDVFAQPTVKSEFPVLGGPISAIAWDADNQRVIAVGSGKEKFGHCFTWDSGNTIGEIQGHSETINAVDIKPQRPYRAATGGDDKSMVFFTGPPFKFDKSSRNIHTNAVRGVKFSPDGKWLVSVGSDRLVAVYDGKTGEFVTKIENAHKGGISAVAWFPDSASFVTASADNTVKRFSAGEWKEIGSYAAGSDTTVEGQLVGLVVTPKYVVALALSGQLLLFPHDESTPERIIPGHQRALTEIAVFGSKLISGGSDGALLQWPIENGRLSPTCELLAEKHSNYISSISSGDELVTSGWDDKLRIWADGKVKKTVELKGQPKGVALTDDIVVLFEDKIEVYSKAGELVGETALKFAASSISAVPGENTVIVSNETDKRAEAYKVGSTVSHDFSFPALRAAPTLVRVSPDGNYVAVAENTGKYTLYSLKDKTAVTTRWAFHSSRVNDAQWTPDSKYLVSGGLDCGIFIYSVARPSKVLKAALTHQTGVSGLAWLSYENTQGTFASAGLDGVVKTWTADFSGY